MRDGPWKLITAARGKSSAGAALYNLDDDLGEQDNVADQHPERVKQMLAALEEWKTDVASGATAQPPPPAELLRKSAPKKKRRRE